jgi:hypothetical protein
MGRESRVLPLNRHHVSEAMNTNAEILEGVRTEVLAHKERLEQQRLVIDAHGAEMGELWRLLREHDVRIDAHATLLNRGLWSRLRSLLTGR